jgi:hypothetical protein
VTFCFESLSRVDGKSNERKGQGVIYISDLLVEAF